MGRGAIDSPPVVAISAAGVPVSGWAFDAAGVVEVQIQAGGRLLGRQQPTYERQDVGQALSGCQGADRSGFSLSIPTGLLSPEDRSIEIRALTRLGQRFSLGTIRLDRPAAFGELDRTESVRWNAPNLLHGWALSAHGPVSVRVRAFDKIVAETKTTIARPDVGRAYALWPGATRSGFEFRLPIAALPRGRYSLTVELLDRNGGVAELAQVPVENDFALGRLVARTSTLANPDELELWAWAYAENGLDRALIETESGIPVGTMERIGVKPLRAFEAEHVADEPSIAPIDLPPGEVFAFRGDAKVISGGLHRLVLRVTDRTGLETLIPGPLALGGAARAGGCAAEPLRVFFPGGNHAMESGFPEMRRQREIIGTGCVEIGMRGRVEYLRSTMGAEHDFTFDPDLPEAHRLWQGREMTGVSLHRLLQTGSDLKVPLLITLDGGVWADSAFSVPELDVVDWLEQDPSTVQWNQFGRAEEDDALSDLAGSIESPQLARMMSLNRFNSRYLNYKKRNLQAAVGEILAFADKHPEVYIAVALDPDQYINPWFFLEQWYDYNPDALRQFREWLFHRGPYVDGGEWADQRATQRWTLGAISRLAGRSFDSIDEVEPPRGAIDYADPWQQLWTQFKRHLVARHYDDLAAWAAEAGMPAERIFTGQTFIQTDVAVEITDEARGWTDQAGVSIRGAKPRHGHIGAILYGPSSRNEGHSRSGLSLIDNLRSIDPDWGSGEFHPATIEAPDQMPSHSEVYTTILAMTNGGARVLSPMWGSRAQDQQLRPARFKAYDSYEGTPFETQFVWWLRQRQSAPVGGLLFPFGNDLVSSSDGWRVDDGTRLEVLPGRLQLAGGSAKLISPAWGGLKADGGFALRAQGEWKEQGMEVVASFVGSDGRRSTPVTCAGLTPAKPCNLPSRVGEFLVGVSLAWPGAERVLVDEVRIEPLR